MRTSIQKPLNWKLETYNPGDKLDPHLRWSLKLKGKDIARAGEYEQLFQLRIGAT